MLQPNYLADIRVESANASAYAQSANEKSVLAESYAIGGTGTREGEDTDNAKYYMEQAKQQTGGIPTKVSELENDAGYITKDADNLTNYYDKITTDQKLANIDLTDYLKKTGDASNTTVTFTEPTELAQPTTGEKLGGIIGKVSLAIKNIKTLITLIGNTDIKSIGDGTVTGAISDVNGKLKSVDYDITFPSGVTTDFVHCKRTGNIVDFGFRILSGSIPYGSPLATLPADLHPKYNILIPSQYLVINDVASTGNVSLMYNGSIFQEYSATGTLNACVIKGTFII